MFKLSQEEIDKMKEEVKELKKKIERLEWFIKINEYNANEHKVYEGSSDLHLDYNQQARNNSNNWEIKPNEDPINKVQKFVEQNHILYEPPFECCKNCPNNFKNNPSSGGICSCDLPYKEMFKW